VHTGQLPHFGLGQLPDRKAQPAQLRLAQHVEHIRLVLGVVAAPAKLPVPCRTRHPSVVAGGNGVEAELRGALQEAVDFRWALQAMQGFGVLASP